MANKKLSAPAAYRQLVGMEFEDTLFLVFVPSQDKLIHTRAQDFRPYKNEQLLGVSGLLKGIARQSASESEQDSNKHADNVFVQAFQVYCIPLYDIAYQ